MTASGPFDFASYRRPQLVEEPIQKPTSDRAAESDDGEMPAENLSNLLGHVSKNSAVEIDSLIGDFQRLREKLKADGERLQREIEEYRTLSQLVMHDEDHLRERGESSSISGSAHKGTSGKRLERKE